ncbi:hypothetical protein IC762_17470 [Bradyrhizobium genosp. L]|uniref:hypothetical protein n=1 Tax=Bradyrhizobium genosp. L TaxID=83637 RepID=UPI0018A3377E|nr:hypothetical protein [Bradyrhizobium genosp. L]QPF81617.1 hypothetical protein IC762_17470 [Bradyrhizobium genosp. L]
MRRIFSFDSSLVLVTSMLLASAPAYAQATRTWVSGVGDDVNPCSRTAPCKTFAGAISKTAAGGEINCLDPGGFGTVTITKAIVIDCEYVPSSILASATNGVNINAGPVDTVILRGLTINGAGTTLGLHGVNILAGLNVSLEKMRIENFSQQAIVDTRSTSAGTLNIFDTYARYSSAGLGVAPMSGTVAVAIDNFRSTNNTYGIALGNNTTATITRSVLANNTISGIDNTGAFIFANDNQISSNLTGVRNQSGGTTRLSNNTLSFNSTGINNVSGSVITYGNNRNTSSALGTITPAGGATSDLGQQ